MEFQQQERVRRVAPVERRFKDQFEIEVGGGGPAGARLLRGGLEVDAQGVVGARRRQQINGEVDVRAVGPRRINGDCRELQPGVEGSPVPRVARENHVQLRMSGEPHLLRLAQQVMPKVSGNRRRTRRAGGEFPFADQGCVGDVAAKPDVRIQQVRLDELEFPDVVGFEEKFASNVLQHECPLRLVGARDGPEEAPALQHHAVGFKIEVAKRPPVQAELRRVEEQARPGHRVRALQLESFTDDAVIPAQSQLAELEFPSVGAELIFNPSSQPVRQSHVIEEQAKDNDDQQDKEDRDPAPFERGEKDPPAQRAGRFRRLCFGILRRAHRLQAIR